MRKFQVWVRGSDLHDVTAKDEAEAKRIIRNFYGWKRLPNGTYVCKTPSYYPDEIVRSNREIGIDITNM